MQAILINILQINYISNKNYSYLNKNIWKICFKILKYNYLSVFNKIYWYNIIYTMIIKNKLVCIVLII